MNSLDLSRQDLKPVVYYDGDCSLCRWFRAGVEGSKEKLEFVDINRQDLPASISRADAQRQIHLVEPDGTVLKNIDAIVRVYEYCQRSGLLRSALRLPGLKSLAVFAYTLLAANRYWLFSKKK